MLRIALALGLVALLVHRSGSPTLFGRYSVSFAAVVMLYLGFSLFLLWTLRPGSRARGRWIALLACPATKITIGCMVILAGSVSGLAFALSPPLALSVSALLWSSIAGVVCTAVRLPPERSELLANRLVGPLLAMAVPALSLAVAEVSLRAWWDVPHYLDRNAFPGRYPVNSLGFREREWGPKLPGDFRVIVLGDSNTFGWGVEMGEAYPRRLEAALARGGLNVEVLNLGRPGANTVDEAGTLDAVGLSLRPDLIVLGYTTNDTEVTGASTVRPWLGPAWRAFLGQARLVLLLDAFQISWARSQQGAASGSTDAGLEDSVRALARIKSHADAAGVPFVVVLMPALVDFEAYPRAGLHEAIARACDRLGIHFLDLLPAFRSSGLTAADLNFGDGHPNTSGHSIIASTLEGFLRRRGLAPGPHTGPATPR